MIHFHVFADPRYDAQVIFFEDVADTRSRGARPSDEHDPLQAEVDRLSPFPRTIHMPDLG